MLIVTQRHSDTFTCVNQISKPTPMRLHLGACSLSFRRMFPLRALRVSVAAILLSSLSSFAANSATQTVTFSVTAINEIAVSGNPGVMAVSTSTAGAAPNTVSDNSTRYAITTNGENRKVTAVIDSALPAGVTLAVDLAAPTGATSRGAVTLATTPIDVVTGITGLSESAKPITYALSATAEAGTVASQSRMITFTVTAGAN